LKREFVVKKSCEFVGSIHPQGWVPIETN